MDILTRQRVLELRRRGSTYGQISEATGASRNTVKSICRRADVAPIVQATGHCEQCQDPLEVEGTRRFCSTVCRLAWWHANPDRLNRKAIYDFTCKHCGEDFTAYGNAARKYCSHSCYVQDRFGTKGGKR